MRRTYVWDPTIRRMVEKAPCAPYDGPRIIPDIQPYQAVGPEYGKVISSRSRHREYLKRHGLIEIGDQKPKWMRNER